MNAYSRNEVLSIHTSFPSHHKRFKHQMLSGLLTLGLLMAPLALASASQSANKLKSIEQSSNTHLKSYQHSQYQSIKVSNDDSDSISDSILYDVGVTMAPCNPEDVAVVHTERGCIYLGILEDRTGPFVPVSFGITAGVKAFWEQVNQEGGIQTKNTKKAFDVAIPNSLTLDDNYGDPFLTFDAIDQFSNNAVAVASTLNFFLNTNEFFNLSMVYAENNLLSGIVNWNSKYLFEEYDSGAGLEDSTSYCFNAMNGVDWLVDNEEVEKIGIIVLDGSYGRDYAAGATIAAHNKGIDVAWTLAFDFMDPTGDLLSALSQSPVDAIIIAGAPGLAVAVALDSTFIANYTGWYVLSTTTFVPDISFDPFLASIFGSRTIIPYNKTPYEFNSTGHHKMQDMYDVKIGFNGAEGVFHSGWLSQYGIKAALEQALKKKDLTQASVLHSASQLKRIDLEGMEAPRSYKYSPNKNAVRTTSIGLIDPPNSGPEGLNFVDVRFVGETAQDYKIEAPCYVLPGVTFDNLP